MNAASDNTKNTRKRNQRITKSLSFFLSFFSLCGWLALVRANPPGEANAKLLTYRSSWCRVTSVRVAQGAPLAQPHGSRVHGASLCFVSLVSPTLFPTSLCLLVAVVALRSPVAFHSPPLLFSSSSSFSAAFSRFCGAKGLFSYPDGRSETETVEMTQFIVTLQNEYIFLFTTFFLCAKSNEREKKSFGRRHRQQLLLVLVFNQFQSY